MKVSCPSCHLTIPAENIALNTGWGKCSTCDGVFPLADLIPGYRPPADAATTNGLAEPVERPFDAWAVVDRHHDRLVVHTPPHGMRAGNWAMLGFATFWLAFITFWTAGALGLFFNNGKAEPANLCFAAFSTPFWLVGFGMLGGVIWSARGTRTVYLDSGRIITQKQCLFWRNRRTLPRTAVQHARPGATTVNSKNQPPSPTCEMIFDKGSFAIPCNSEAEQRWLVAEINGFLKAVPTDESESAAVENGTALNPLV